MPGAKRLRFREAALADVEDAARWYAEHAGIQVADDFLTELARAYGHIGLNPGTGSPRWGLALNLPGVRSWRLNRFAHLVFYVEREAEVEIWRVLHGARDIPASLAEPEDPSP
jgi:toxin ParE1/3/4